jgi:arabinogalactan endo-1,4-beta-galactosidase
VAAGALEQLLTNMQNCTQRYHRNFLVAGTGYGASHSRDNPHALWPVTALGRLQFIVNMVQYALGLGVVFWAQRGDWAIFIALQRHGTGTDSRSADRAGTRCP